jgi:Fe-S cluster biosynthesis and repair protein YggX
MADERSGPPKPAGTATTQTGPHTVMCVKFGKKMEGLDRVPWKGELGQKIYENVSKEAWKMWIEHSKMIMNEYRLNPLDAQSQKIMEEQMEQFFFGEGAKLPEGYIPPRAKS